MFDLLLLAPIGAILALGFAALLSCFILKQPEGTDKMQRLLKL